MSDLAELLKAKDASIDARRRSDENFDRWMRLNVLPHRVPGHVIVNISLKEPGKIPGDASADQMDAVASLAERFGNDEIRVTYQQNLVLPNVAVRDLAAIYDGLVKSGIETANTELITDIIAEMLAKPANRKAGIPQLLQELLKRQYPIRVLYTAGHWLDINSIEDVVQAGNF